MAKEAGRFDRKDGESELAYEGKQYWVRVGDTEGFLAPRQEGFGFYPVDPDDEDFVLDKDYGPTSSDAIPPEGIPLDRWDDDINDDGLIRQSARYVPNR